MLKSVTAKTFMIIAFAAFVAGVLVLLTSVGPEAKAGDSKGDGLAAGPACSAQSWPHYEPRCQFDLRTASGQGRPVRTVAIP